MKYLFLIILFVGCGSKLTIGTHPTPPKDSLIESALPVRPVWITKTPEASGCKYFVGEELSGKTKEEEARESAIADMLKRYAEYLGIDFKVLTQIHQEEIKKLKDDIHRTERRVITDIEALCKIITAGSEIKEKYWEKWAKISGNNIEYYYYKYWVLGKVEERFIEEERERIKRLKDWKDLNINEKNSDLDIFVYEKKGKYKVGEEFLLEVEANDNCYIYFLNFYGEGKVKFLGSEFVEKGSRCELKGKTIYEGGEEKIIIFACEKEIDINSALKEVYPLAIIENLKNQAKGKRYTIKTITYLVER
ncbi:MAG: hypothetical protein NZ608_06020 [candidate division WOR-3 bacterium]|nr:hypothetical protein [candidate division WOR-3 bacterium]